MTKPATDSKSDSVKRDNKVLSSSDEEHRLISEEKKQEKHDQENLNVLFREVTLSEKAGNIGSEYEMEKSSDKRY